MSFLDDLDLLGDFISDPARLAFLVVFFVAYFTYPSDINVVSILISLPYRIFTSLFSGLAAGVFIYTLNRFI